MKEFLVSTICISYSQLFSLIIGIIICTILINLLVSSFLLQMKMEISKTGDSKLRYITKSILKVFLLINVLFLCVLILEKIKEIF